jgi:hypothetical protein
MAAAAGPDIFIDRTINWIFETYFELPPKGGVDYDINIPKATNCRYWRICVRTDGGELAHVDF